MDRKLILKLTAGNLRQNHLYIGGHLDFFPADAIAPARRSAGFNGHGIEIVLSGCVAESLNSGVGASCDELSGDNRI